MEYFHLIDLNTLESFPYEYYCDLGDISIICDNPSIQQMIVDCDSNSDLARFARGYRQYAREGRFPMASYYSLEKGYKRLTKKAIRMNSLRSVGILWKAVLYYNLDTNLGKDCTKIDPFEFDHYYVSISYLSCLKTAVKYSNLRMVQSMLMTYLHHKIYIRNYDDDGILMEKLYVFAEKNPNPGITEFLRMRFGDRKTLYPCLNDPYGLMQEGITCKEEEEDYRERLCRCREFADEFTPQKLI